MLNNKIFLAIIPARSGSKRLPNKNIKELCGKPLIAWSIEVGLNSKYVDEVMVATDDEYYAKIARDYGAQVPFILPSALSQDDTPTYEVIEYVIEYYKKRNRKFDYIALLQPTSPLRKSLYIDEVREKIISKKVDTIIGVCEHLSIWSNQIPINESMKNFLNKKIINIHSQDLPKYYRLNGVIFVVNTEKFIMNKTVFIKDTYVYKMPIEFSVDIDNKIDLMLAKCFMIKNNYSMRGANSHLIYQYPSFIKEANNREWHFTQGYRNAI